MSVSTVTPGKAGAARPLARLLSVDAALLALTYVLAPNVPFMAMWFFITPRRLFAVPFYLIAGLLAVHLPLWAGALLIAAVAVFDVLLVISGIFDLSPMLVLDAIQFAPMLDLGGSALYAGLGGIIALTVATVVWLTHKYRPRLAAASPMLALVLMFAWLGVEASANFSVSKLFGSKMGSIVPFDSALRKSGLSAIYPARAERNLLIVTVEGMGAFADPAHTKLLTSFMDTGKVRARYDVSSGTSPYLGSTTAAAARELCGEWADYLDYRDGPARPCLPRRLSSAGYETIAVHGFTGKFFDRDIWYPKIGFNRALFGEQMARGLLRSNAARCGLTFKGLCDRDVGEVVRDLLTQDRDKKRFIYWLTLNTHMPFNRKEATPRFDCARDGGVFGDKTVCYLSEMWADVTEKVTSIAMDPNLPPTDILIVGDHNTPLFTRAARGAFIQGEVTWIALKSKASGSVTAQTTAVTAP